MSEKRYPTNQLILDPEELLIAIKRYFDEPEPCYIQIGDDSENED